MRHTVIQNFLIFSCSVCILQRNVAAEENQADTDRLTKKADILEPKLKRQNDGTGEEVDLNGIPDVEQPNQPNPNQQPLAPQPGQPPFIGGNPFFPQQPFYNGYGFPGANPGFQPQGFQPQGFQPQGFPPQGFQPQGYPQFNFPGQSVILQNNGKQYLVQPLAANQKIVQKNGKQYLLQPVTGTNAALTNANGNGVPVYNVPNAALTGLTGGVFGPGGAAYLQNAALTAGGGNPLFSANSPQRSPATGGVTAIRPEFLPGSGKITTLNAPQRLILSNGKGFAVEQIPISVQGGNSPYLQAAVGAVAGQLAAQGPYATQQYAPSNIGLSSAYARANQAGYGLFPTGRLYDGQSGPSSLERNAKSDNVERRDIS